MFVLDLLLLTCTPMIFPDPGMQRVFIHSQVPRGLGNRLIRLDRQFHGAFLECSGILLRSGLTHRTHLLGCVLSLVSVCPVEYNHIRTLRHQTIRYDPKRFTQRHPHPSTPGEYLWNLQGVDLVLYHLRQVLDAIEHGEPVYISEGEKDCDTLEALGLTATTNALGAGKWRKSYTETLRRAHVILLPHNDEPGRKHAARIATALEGVAATCRVVPGLHTGHPGSDISDWIAAGHTREDLEAAVRNTRPSPAAVGGADAEAPTAPLCSHFVRNDCEQSLPHEIKAKPLCSLNSLCSHPSWPQLRDDAWYGV